MTVKNCVLFFGEIRGCKAQWEILNNNLIIPNNADVFIYCYYYDKNFLNKFNQHEKNVYLEYQINKGINKIPPFDLFDIFKPKSILLEQNKSHIDENCDEIFNVLKLHNSYYCSGDRLYVDYNICRSQSWSRKKVIDLKNEYEKSNNIFYDNVILTRLDYNLLRPLDFNYKINYNTIKCWINTYDNIKEQILVGSSDAINHVADFYNDSPQLYKSFCNAEHYFLQFEHFLCVHLRNKGVNLEHFEFHSDYSKNGLNRFTKTILENGETCEILR